MTRRRSVPLHYWALYIVLLAAGLFIFYVLFTPVWMGIRLLAWLAEGRRSRLQGHGES